MATITYETWLRDVDDALKSISMPMDEWQGVWAFDFPAEFAAGASANDAAAKANRYWWKRQNESLNQHCVKRAGCWLPRDHQGECEPA